MKNGRSDRRKKNTSKFISLILRHKPETIGISLDEHGWADVQELIDGVNRSGGHFLDIDLLEEIVRSDEKQRYSFNEEHTLIRVNQGHSIPVDVELEEKNPPDILWHGTGDKFVASIDQQGLIPKNRLYVHLSSDIETAKKVGSRHGRPVIYQIDCRKMVKDGFHFYLSANKIWLTKSVPARYLKKDIMIDKTIKTENEGPGSEYLQAAIKQFRRNGFTVSYFEKGKDAADYLCDQIQGKTVGFGDSATLAALHLAERLREKNRVNDPGPYRGEGFYRVAREAMNTDVFLLSVNAASASGELVNIDSSGNRVGGSLFGHEKVYFVFSADKIESSLEKAVWRARNIAAPQNARRFGFRTPCAIKGDKCYDCSSPDRICNVLAIHMRKEKHMEEELVIIGENVLQHE